MSHAEYKHLPRLFLAEKDFSSQKDIEISDTQAHYLRNVMRKSVGDALRVFNGQDGEWLSDIKELNKKKAIINLSKQIYKQTSSPDIWVLASPIKKEPFEWMIEKASELGASKFFPLEMERTVVHRVNDERMRLIAIEAAEQAERLDILETHQLQSLFKLLNGWDLSRKIIFCLERHQALPIAESLKTVQRSEPLAVLVGPEGGFTSDEIDKLLKMPCIIPVSLGGRILRAETALCAVLSCVQSQCGDWT